MTDYEERLGTCPLHEAKRRISWWASMWRGHDGNVSFGSGHYLSWLSDRRPKSGRESSEGVSRTGLMNPSNSVSALSSAWLPTKSFSHSSAVESSEAEGGPLSAGLPPGLRAARRMSSSVRDLSQAGSPRFIPTTRGHERSVREQRSRKVLQAVNWWLWVYDSNRSQLKI